MATTQYASTTRYPCPRCGRLIARKGPVHNVIGVYWGRKRGRQTRQIVFLHGHNAEGRRCPGLNAWAGWVQGAEMPSLPG